MEIKTDPAEFERFYNLLTTGNNGYVPFIFPLTMSDKDPQADRSWKNNRIDLETALKLLKHGVNVGIAATSDDNLVIVDVDDMVAVGDFKQTLTCASRKRVGRHAFYFTDDIKTVDIFTDTAKQNIAVEDAGEVRADWQYVVAAGSYVPVDEQKYDAIPDNDKCNAGKYSIIEPNAVSSITFNELPMIFTERINDQRKIDIFNKNKPEKEYTITDGQEHSAIYDLTITDVISTTAKNGKRFPSVFHGSDTGKNTALSDGMLHCFRCNVAHSPLTALAVLAGVDSCESAGYGHRGTGSSSIDFDDGATIFKIWEYAKRNNIIDVKDKIPTKALVYYSIFNDICSLDDIEDGWKIPPALYNQTLQALSNNGIVSGRNELAIPIPIMNDLGRAKMFTMDYRNTVKFSHTMNSWYIWDGKRWQIDASGKIHQCAKNTIKNMYTSVLPHIDDTDVRKKFLGSLIKAENQNALKSMLESASNEHGIPIDVLDFDTQKGLINVENGIVDLQTGKLLKHDKSYKMTRMLSLEYDKTNKCDKWLTFLDETFEGDKNLIEFIKRFLGYSLTGYTDEQVFCIFYGHGSNGKGTLIDTIMNVMGEYAKTTEPETIIKKKYERSSTNDLADLWGARFVTTSETESYQELDEGRVKRITGQDAIKCRFLYKDLFEYFPEYKLVLLTNHEPVIKSQDYSIWRRVLKIPFNVKRPKEEWNLNLRTELIDEREGIFAWLVEGAVAWHKDGLKVPETVIQATEDYKDDLDVIGDFLDMCTDDGENLQVRNIDLFRCYEQWCEGTNNKPFTNRTFSRSLVEREYKNIKISGLRGKKGLDIKNDIKHLMENEIFCKDMQKMPLCILPSTDSDVQKTLAETTTGTLDEPKNTMKDVRDTKSTVFGKSPREIDKNKIVQKNDILTSQTSPSSILTVDSSKELTFRLQDVVNALQDGKNSLHPDGIIKDFGLFCFHVKKNNPKLKNVEIDDMVQIAKKLSKDGWK